MKTKIPFHIPGLILLFILGAKTPTCLAQGTAFTYQGQLQVSGAAANGVYDLSFIVCTNSSGPSQVGGTFTWLDIPVTNGLFTVELDFGSTVFTNADRWLEISVKTNGGGAFATLEPRHRFTSTPYAIQAARISGSVSDSQLPANIARLNVSQTFIGTNIVVGRVGIGTSATGAPLEVRTGDASGNAIRFGFNAGGSAGNLIAGPARVSIATDDLVERLCIRQSGNVGLGLTGPNYLLHLATDSAGKPNGGSWANSSDARLKKNIQPLLGALDRLTQLRGVSFEWVNPEDHANQTGRQGGFVAQEVERAFPNWVQEIPGGEHDAALTPNGRIKSLSLPFEFDALTVEALRELRAENSDLKQRVTRLEQLLTQKYGNAR